MHEERSLHERFQPHAATLTSLGCSHVLHCRRDCAGQEEREGGQGAHAGALGGQGRQGAPHRGCHRYVGHCTVVKARLCCCAALCRRARVTLWQSGAAPDAGREGAPRACAQRIPGLHSVATRPPGQCKHVVSACRSQPPPPVLARSLLPWRAGKGVAAARVVRDARALEEAIASGMVRKKGMGKKKKALKCECAPACVASLPVWTGA